MGDWHTKTWNLKKLGYTWGSYQLHEEEQTDSAYRSGDIVSGKCYCTPYLKYLYWVLNITLKYEYCVFEIADHLNPFKPI